MSGHELFELPVGRRLDTPGNDPGYVGTIRVLQPADEAHLRLARKNLREIPAKNIKGDGKYLVEKSSGETLEVVTSFVDLVDPKMTGTTAFTVRDGLLVPLRPVGASGPVESREAGEIFGRQAGPKDAMPMPVREIF